MCADTAHFYELKIAIKQFLRGEPISSGNTKSAKEKFHTPFGVVKIKEHNLEVGP